MHERALRAMQEKARLLRFRFTVHALDEVDDDGLTLFDVQAVIMSETIVARQADERFGSW